MKYLAAYALCQLSGKAPTKDAVKAVLKAAGVAIDEARVNELFANFEGKNFDTTVAEGLKKVSAGGVSAGGASAAAPAPVAAAAGKKEEAKKEAPKKKEPEPEEDDDMIGGLF